MKSLSLSLVFSLFGTSVIAGDISFPIHNNGASDLISFKFSESGANNWADVFEGDQLARGESTDVVLKDEDSCLFDIKAKFSDGSTLNETGVNLCELGGGYNFK